MALTNTLTNIGDAIREKTGGTELIPLKEMASVILTITNGDGGTDTRLKDFIEGTLTELVDDTIEEVGAYTFYNKTFTKVELPNCTVVGNYGFQYSNIPTVILPKVETVGTGTFLNSKVVEVNFPLLTNGDFTSCSELTKAVFTKIDNPKFKLCKKLIYCDLGTEVTNLPKEAFSTTSALETLIIRNPSVVPTKQSNTFTYSAINDTGFIYVPDDMVESYKTSWSGLADRIKGLSELPT